ATELLHATVGRIEHVDEFSARRHCDSRRLAELGFTQSFGAPCTKEPAAAVVLEHATCVSVGYVRMVARTDGDSFDLLWCAYNPLEQTPPIAIDLIGLAPPWVCRVEVSTTVHGESLDHAELIGVSPLGAPGEHELAAAVELLNVTVEVRDEYITVGVGGEIHG